MEYNLNYPAGNDNKEHFLVWAMEVKMAHGYMALILELAKKKFLAKYYLNAL